LLKDIHIVIVHGWDSSPTSNWFPWLKSNLETKGAIVSVPEMPNPALPQVLDWIECIHQSVPTSGKVFFVGHSLGCIAIVHYLSKYGRNISCLGSVFVAGFSGNIQNPATANFYRHSIDFNQVIRFGGKMTAIFSEDDPVVSLERARVFAENIQAKAVVVNGFRHFVGSEGVTELPIALEEVLASLS
jgi:predicted alpha/beta hydrolase family esterase